MQPLHRPSFRGAKRAAVLGPLALATAAAFAPAASLEAAATRGGGGTAADYRAQRITRFTNEAELLGFELHGVSLVTPWGRSVALLKQNGWDEIGSPRPDELRQFIKGPRTPSAGETTQSVMLRRTPLGLEITFGRREGGSHATRKPTEPLADVPEVRAARRLKALVCNGIPNAVERHAACPPDTPAEIVAGSVGRESLLLTPRVHVVRLRATADGVTIHLRLAD